LPSWERGRRKKFKGLLEECDILSIRRYTAMSITTETLTIHLPESAARRLCRVAEIAGRPVDKVAAETLCAGLPPLLEDVPPAFQADLARLETLPSEEVREQMRAILPPEDVTRYESLKATHEERSLNDTEQQEWETLRLEADRLMFRRAYAALLLKWRGEHVPTLADIETSH
jgi:hypothetical protein